MVRRLFKWLLRLVLLLVVLIVLVFVFKDTILRNVIENRIRERTGMEVKIGKMSSSLFSQTYTLENVSVYNPPEYGGTKFLQVNELHLELNPTDLAQQKVRVTLARLNLAELHVVRNEQDQTNVFTILEKVRLRTKKLGGWQKLFGDFHLTGVDVLNLSVGKVRYIDLKDPKKSSETNINLRDQVYRDLNTKATIETDLIVLWFGIGNKMPITANEVIRIYNSRTNNNSRTNKGAIIIPPAAANAIGPPR